MEKYLDILKELGAQQAVTIHPNTVVTAPWTLHKCKFGCANYGKNYCCPPNTPDWAEMQKILDCFERGVLFSCPALAAVNTIAAEAARRLFLEGAYKAIAFGAGPCTLCESCAGDHCRHPGKALPSMEACGVDVFATLRANGLDLQTLKSKDEAPSCWGLILVD